MAALHFHGKLNSLNPVLNLFMLILVCYLLRIHLWGAIDIGFKSFSYYEKTREEKVLPAKIYTWDKFYDMNTCSRMPTKCPKYNPRISNPIDIKTCESCEKITNCKYIGGISYILSILVTVLLCLILLLYREYGISAYRWAIILTIPCFAMNMASIIIFPSQLCTYSLVFGVTGSSSTPLTTNTMKGRTMQIATQVLLFLSFFVHSDDNNLSGKELEEYDRKAAKYSEKPFIYQDEHVNIQNCHLDSGCFNLDYHEKEELLEMKKVHVKALSDEDCFHQGAAKIIK